MIKNRISNLLLALMITVMLSACGGGGDIPGIKQTLLQYRIKSATVDLDNNGTAEGTLNYSYDSRGRLTQIDYVYTADGVDDSFLDYLPKATLLPDKSLAEYHETRLYNHRGWPAGSNITRVYPGSGSGSPFTWVNASEYMYGADGINSIVSNFLDGSGTLESTTTASYLNFVDGLPEQIEYEYVPPPFGAPVFDTADITRNSQGRVETLHNVDQYGDIDESFTIEWDEARIASYKANFKEYPLSLDEDTTVDFEYEDNCLTKEQYQARGVSLGADIMKDATVTYTHDPATGTPLYLEIDNNSDGSVDARIDFEIESGPYRIYTYSTLRAPDLIDYPTFQALDQSSELEHALFCKTAPSLLDVE